MRDACFLLPLSTHCILICVLWQWQWHKTLWLQCLCLFMYVQFANADNKDIFSFNIYICICINSASLPIMYSQFSNFFFTLSFIINSNKLTFSSFKIKTYCTNHNFQVSNVIADKCNVQVYWTMSKQIWGKIWQSVSVHALNAYQWL